MQIAPAITSVKEPAAGFLLRGSSNASPLTISSAPITYWDPRGYPQLKSLLPHRAAEGPQSFENPTAANSSAKIIESDQVTTGESLPMRTPDFPDSLRDRNTAPTSVASFVSLRQLKYPQFRPQNASQRLQCVCITCWSTVPAMLKKFGEFELDESSRTLSCEGQPVKLTGQALDLLCLLVKRPGELIPREEIEHCLWPDSNVDFEHGLDVLLSRLRAVLGDSGKNARYIETVPKRGYRFLAQVSCERTLSYRWLTGSWARRLWTYAAIALLAALISVLIARTRYQKFIPPKQAPAPTSPSVQAK